MKRIIFDTSNLLFRVVFAAMKDIKTDEDKKFVEPIVLQGVLKYFLKFFNEVKPDVVAFAFEGSENWRVDYTKDKEKWCTGVGYKANRNNVDPAVRALHKKTMIVVKEFIERFTSCVVIRHEMLEGDDCIAGYVHKHANNGDTVVCVSGDRDFLQLYQYGDKFVLLNPESGEHRTLVEDCGVDDWEFFIFLKCIRGDKGDNVPSAFPRIRHTKIVEAFNDPVVREQVMNSEIMTEGENKTLVKTRFYENKTMMDLSNQPDHVKQVIARVIDQADSNTGKFCIIKFAAECKRLNLPTVAKNIHAYAKMFGTSKNVVKARENTYEFDWG